MEHTSKTMNAEQLRANGWVEFTPGRWQKGRFNASLPLAVALEKDIQSDMKSPKRIRQSTKPLLNKLESECFEYLKLNGLPMFAQSISFRLANGLRYKPDFFAFEWPAVGELDRPTGFEVKGPHAFRGGFENLKMAATTYPQIRWILLWKQDGKWQQQRVLP